MYARNHPLFSSLATVFLIALAGSVPWPSAKAADTVTVRFENSETAVINARSWDSPQQQWCTGKEKEEPRFFDAVHRFLLVRFPGLVDALGSPLGRGLTPVKADLELTWEKQEWLRVAGYHHRGYRLKEKPVDEWHAEVWGLYRPWISDPELGPTWNAFVNGVGYWREGGARALGNDRSQSPLGLGLLSRQHPAATVDVTALLTDDAGAATLTERLGRLETCGVLLKKAELCGPHHGEWGLSTGNARIWIAPPVLTLTFRSTDAPPGPITPPLDIRTRLDALRKDPDRGAPTTVLPDDLPQRAAEIRADSPDMPEWMAQRVREVRQLDTPYDARDPLGFGMADDLESGDPERYNAVIAEILRCPPGWFRGHSHLDFMIPLLRYNDLLPEVVRYHLREYFRARWLPPYSETDLRHRVGYHGGMATLNHQSQFRTEAILAGELLGFPDLELMGRRNLALMNRQMIFSEGTSQERGDSFYLGISLGTLQMAARYSNDPITRLRASLIVEKLLFEALVTYHPGLRRRVSRISRRYRLDDLMLSQCAPRGIMHTFSRKGVLIETDKLRVHTDANLKARLDAGEDLTPEQRQRANGIPTLNFHPCPPARIALLAPWAHEWEANLLDNKELPFTSISTDYVRGHMRTPIYNVTYLAPNYGLSSSSCDLGLEWPVLGVWRRTAGTVDTLDDLAIMFPWPYLNDRAVSMYNQQETVAVKWNCPSATLQAGRRMLYVVRPPERVFAEKDCTNGIGSFSSRISIFAYGRTDTPKLYVNGEPVTTFPATAMQGDVITLDDGAAYAALVAIPASNLGRRNDVRITYRWPRLNLDSYVIDRKTPVQADDSMWEQLADAVTGWSVELADSSDVASFAEFQQAAQHNVVASHWDPKARIHHVAGTFADQELDMGVLTSYLRSEPGERYISPEKLIAYQRVDGKSPWPDRGIDIDSPIGQMGKAALLKAAGAELHSTKGQMALLKADPLSETYEAVNPFITPQLLELRTPQGIVLRSDGPITLCRITVHAQTGKLDIDTHLPPPGGDPAVALLQQAAREGLHAGGDFEVPMSRILSQDEDLQSAAEHTARHLLVTGFDAAPTVLLNDRSVAPPTERITADGATWWRIPLYPDAASDD